MGEPASDLHAGLESVTASVAKVEDLPREAQEGNRLARQDEMQPHRALLNGGPCGRVEKTTEETRRVGHSPRCRLHM